MNTRIAPALGLIAAAALSLAACSSGGYGDDNGSNQDPYATAASTPGATMTSGGTTATGASLMTADTSLGTIVTDGDGMVVYQYDADTQGSGSSACSGSCLSNWPAVPGGADAPTLTGITGDVTTITGTDGNPQLALNGWPLYYFAGDVNAGDTNGQAVGGVWWVVTPDGTPVH
jgi:predicted lipoprotein with Yx(FWY)xxD motif